MISSGVEMIKMPDLRELEISKAEGILNEKGIRKITKTEVFNDNYQSGIVMESNPKVNTEITVDTSVELVVSKGPERRVTEVPNVRGLSMDDAKSTITSAKLTPIIETKETDREDEDGKVIDQSLVGDSVEEWTSVTIYVGKYVKPPVEMINVDELGLTGKTVADARGILESKGLKVDTSGAKDDYIVTGYTPGNAEKGSTIKLTSEKPKEQKPGGEVKPPEAGGNGEGNPVTSNMDGNNDSNANNNGARDTGSN